MAKKVAMDYDKNKEWDKAADAYYHAIACYQQYKSTIRNEGVQRRIETLMKPVIKRAKIMEDRSREYKEQNECSLDNMQMPQQLIDESFALLSLEEDESERFNKLWGVVEPMMNNLPDVGSKKESNKGTMTNMGEEEHRRIKREMSAILESYFVVPHERNDNICIQFPENSNSEQGGRFPDQSTLSSSSEHAWKVSKKQNEELKNNIMILTGHIQELEKKSINNNVLKSNIAQFKNDVHKEAKRILQTHEATMMTRSAIAPGTPKNNRNTTSNAELIIKIRELEIENRNLKSQNRKQEDSMNKYIERWESVKESAKKRQPT